MPILRMISILLVLALIIALLFACADDDDDDDSGGGGPEYEKCVTFLEEICEKIASCTDSNYGECINYFLQEFACEDIIQVEDSYDECIDAIQSTSCDEILDPDWDLPEPCVGVFLTY